MAQNSGEAAEKPIANGLQCPAYAAQAECEISVVYFSPTVAAGEDEVTTTVKTSWSTYGLYGHYEIGMDVALYGGTNEIPYDFISGLFEDVTTNTFCPYWEDLVSASPGESYARSFIIEFAMTSSVEYRYFIKASVLSADQTTELAADDAETEFRVILIDD